MSQNTKTFGEEFIEERNGHQRKNILDVKVELNTCWIDVISS
jgi:hypothetical protein